MRRSERPQIAEDDEGALIWIRHIALPPADLLKLATGGLENVFESAFGGRRLRKPMVAPERRQSRRAIVDDLQSARCRILLARQRCQRPGFREVLHDLFAVRFAGLADARRHPTETPGQIRGICERKMFRGICRPVQPFLAGGGWRWWELVLSNVIDLLDAGSDQERCFRDVSGDKFDPRRRLGPCSLVLGSGGDDVVNSTRIEVVSQ